FAFQLEPTMRFAATPHDIFVIEQVTIFGVRDFTFTAASIEVVRHPQLLFSVTGFEQRVEFVWFIWLHLLLFEIELRQNLSTAENPLGPEQGIDGLEAVVHRAGTPQLVLRGFLLA